MGEIYSPLSPIHIKTYTSVYWLLKNLISNNIKALEDKKILANAIFIQEKTNFNLVLSDSDVEKVIFKHQEIPTHLIEDIAKNEDRNNFIAQYYCDNKTEFGKTIIFLDRWYQCHTVENYLNKMAGKEIASSIFSYVDSHKDIHYINSRTANQNEINLERFRNGEVEVLLNVKMLTEGVDVPDVKSVFLTRDTNSHILFTQMVGRALRGEGAGGNKTTANVVLFSDNWNRHIHFASNRLFGGKEDNEIKERGYRPLELIRIDLLDKLELEYQNQNYEKSVFELIPIGWYVVVYTDSFEDENQDQENTESFVENVIVLDQEEFIFQKFIQEYAFYHKNMVWEKEVLDFELAEKLIVQFLELNGLIPNRASTSKLIQIARHLGQNNTTPDYFTFEQKNDINLMTFVVAIREHNYGRDQAEDYLAFEYEKTENPFLKVMFPSYEDFYRAYEYEDNVYRRRKRGNIKISEASQEIKVHRLANEEIRRIVFSRDGHKCLCCGKSNNLQIDHIISFKLQEPDDDNPDLYQTLCGVCNREKSSNAYNYRITNYDPGKMSVENVLTTPHEDPGYYFTRMINYYFKTNAVQPESLKAISHGSAVWMAALKYGVDPEQSILKEKEALIKIIRSKSYRLKNIEIVAK